MGRQNSILTSRLPYHITARSHNRDRYPLPLKIIWKIMLENLWLTRHIYDLRIHSFVLMPNHFHMLASAPQINLSQCMQYFMNQSARQINWCAGTINQIHGSRYFKCVLGSPHYFFHAYKYVYRNPAKANLCSSVEEYSFSTLRMRLGLSALDLPLEPDDLLMDDITGTLIWLNTAPKESMWLEVRKAMRHPEFKLFADKKTRRQNPLEIALL